MDIYFKTIYFAVDKFSFFNIVLFQSIETCIKETLYPTSTENGVNA